MVFRLMFLYFMTFAIGILCLLLFSSIIFTLNKTLFGLIYVGDALTFLKGEINTPEDYLHLILTLNLTPIFVLFLIMIIDLFSFFKDKIKLSISLLVVVSLFFTMKLGFNPHENYVQFVLYWSDFSSLHYLNQIISIIILFSALIVLYRLRKKIYNRLKKVNP